MMRKWKPIFRFEFHPFNWYFIPRYDDNSTIYSFTWLCFGFEYFDMGLY